MKSLVIELKHNRTQQLVIALVSSSFLVLVSVAFLSTFG
jgi:hypothetical protein